jgi:glycosyltransferase involved in cell wall biosynthesis
MSVSVVVPAFNEEILIGNTLKSIPDFVDRIYVVDDGSTDRTGEIVQVFSREDRRIHQIVHKHNMGVGAAIVSGYQASLKDGIDAAVVMAGDNQMLPDKMPLLLDHLTGKTADYAKGNRLISRKYRKGMSRWRFFGNTILTFLTRVSSGYWDLMDPQNGYTAISSRALKSIDLKSIYPGYGYCNDLLVMLNVGGFKVVDVGMPAHYGNEKSKIRYKSYIPRVASLLLKDFFWRLKAKYIFKGFHPVVFFYILGLILIPLGIIVGLIPLYHKYVLGGFLFSVSVLSILLITTGMLSLLFAMLIDYQKNQRLKEPNSQSIGGK